MRPPNAITRPRVVADRDHQPAAEAVVGLLAALDLDEHPRFDQHRVSICLSADLSFERESGARPKPNAVRVASDMPRFCR
jgi:hypothetical protein